MELLELPLEMLKRIIETSVVVLSLEQAIMMRLVCKTFDAEVIQAICTTKALEAPDCGIKTLGERLMVEYVIARTLADRACVHHLSEVIRDTVNYILEERPQDEAYRVNYMRDLCVATVRSHGRWEAGVDIYDLLNPTNVRLRKGQSPHRLECSVLENALAATLYLGISTLSQKLTGDGVEDVVTYFGRPLKIAAGRGDLDITCSLLEKRFASPRLRRGAMGKAAWNGHTAIIELLLDPKYNTEIADDAGNWYWNTYEWVIRQAAEAGHLDTILFLIQKADSGGILDTWRKTAMMRFKSDQRPTRIALQDIILWTAALRGQEEVARMALDNGANPNGIRSQLFQERTPLDAAARNGHEGVVRLLLARGAKVVTRHGLQPIAHAARGGWLRVMQILIENGAEVNPATSRENEVPLMVAVLRGQVDSLRLLLENGANLDAGLAIGKEAYSYAASRGYTSIMRTLIENGVEATFSDYNSP